MMSILLVSLMLACGDLPVVTVDAPGVEIHESSRVEITTSPLPDPNGDGVIRILGSDITVDFSDQHLRGAAGGSDPDQYTGVGVRILGENVTIRGGTFSGYKACLHASEADGLTIEDVTLDDYFRQRLRSTPEREATEDWLRPHENDENHWLHRYGAGIYIEDSENVTVRRVRARNGQNGIILDRVNHARIYDNDCSFLSGWGLALWRSNHNVITRNAFDFCVRGYSHGVYNRGQDSAGILFFEQCSDNLVAQNSATHGGDGFFGFAGREALGEVNPRDDLEWYEGRGNNRNILIENDFSYAVAHGIEMTFSFDNQFIRNRLVGNAICGIWGGFSQNTQISRNIFKHNGEMPYGNERGGVNIEHGARNRIHENDFRHNACGVYIWSRESHPLLDRPWAKANHKGSSDNVIAFNDFHYNGIAIQIERSTRVEIGRNDFYDGNEELLSMDDDTSETIRRAQPRHVHRMTEPQYEVFGENEPVGAREHLAGREHIIMTEWGPYDWQSSLLDQTMRSPERHVFRLLGVGADTAVHTNVTEGVTLDQSIDGDIRTWVLTPLEQGRVTPYSLTVEVVEDGETFTAEGMLSRAEWTVRVFEWQTDPREDVEQWRTEAEDGVEFTHPHLHLRYGHGGPGDMNDAPEHVREADLPADRFGTTATATVTIPAGKWRLRTVSDDGIRVWMDDKVVIDDWTWHPPTEHTHDFEITEERAVELRVEHFELDGYAILILDIEPAE